MWYAKINYRPVLVMLTWWWPAQPTDFSCSSMNNCTPSVLLMQCLLWLQTLYTHCTVVTSLFCPSVGLLGGLVSFADWVPANEPAWVMLPASYHNSICSFSRCRTLGHLCGPRNGCSIYNRAGRWGIPDRHYGLVRPTVQPSHPGFCLKSLPLSAAAS